MAVIGTDSFFYDKFTKEFYMPGWSDLENNQTTTVKFMRKRQVPFVGRRAVIALRVGRTAGVQAIAPSQIAGVSVGAAGLPTAGYQPVENAFVKPCIIMLAIGIPQDTIDISSSDKGAFMDVLDFEMMGAKADAANYEDKICYKGGTGLTAIVSVTNPTNFVVDNYYPFFKNQKLAFYATATTGGRTIGQLVSTAVVTAINRSTRTITIGNQVFASGGSGAFTTIVATDLVYTRGARPETATAGDLVQFEPWGLEAIVNTANPSPLTDLDNSAYYLGVNRTSIVEWQSQLVDCGGVFSYEKSQQVLDQISDESGGNANLALTHKATRRKIALKFAFGYAAEPTAAAIPTWHFDTIRTEGGIVPRTEDKHGQESDDWMRLNQEIPIVLDRYASHDFANNKGTIWFLDTRRWYEAIVTNWKFWAPEGRIFREAQNTNSFGVVAHAYKFYQRVCDAPNTAGKLYNITTT